MWCEVSFCIDVNSHVEPVHNLATNNKLALIALYSKSGSCAEDYSDD